MVPSNFKFSANSSFVNDGKMIYQNTQKGKVLVYYDQIESGVMNVPEGVNGIQVGAFINMQELKTLVLPSTFSFINYNLNLNVSIANSKFKNIEDRIPKLRGGNAYMYNCIVDNFEYMSYRSQMKSIAASAV